MFTTQRLLLILGISAAICFNTSSPLHARSYLQPHTQKDYQNLTSTRNICDLDNIYNSSFKYSLPRTMLESFRSGKAFDNTISYTSNELDCVDKDALNIFNRIISQNPKQEKLLIATCGSPGTGKTTLQKQHRLEFHKDFAYICPDDVCLKQMDNTYLKEFQEEQEKPLPIALRDLYTKWRPASNYICHTILPNLVQEGLGIYFGTTSSSPFTKNFFQFLKDQGYSIHLLHTIAPDDVRVNSIKQRDQEFVQTTDEDIVEKGKLIPQRINDTYLKFADKIEFYFRKEVDSDAILVATWERHPAQNILTIFDKANLEEMVSVHNAKCINEEDRWENSVLFSIEEH